MCKKHNIWNKNQFILLIKCLLYVQIIVYCIARVNCGVWVYLASMKCYVRYPVWRNTRDWQKIVYITLYVLKTLRVTVESFRVKLIFFIDWPLNLIHFYECDRTWPGESIKVNLTFLSFIKTALWVFIITRKTAIFKGKTICNLL